MRAKPRGIIAYQPDFERLFSFLLSLEAHIRYHPQAAVGMPAIMTGPIEALDKINRTNP